MLQAHRHRGNFFQIIMMSISFILVFLATYRTHDGRPAPDIVSLPGPAFLIFVLGILVGAGMTPSSMQRLAL